MHLAKSAIAACFALMPFSVMADEAKPAPAPTCGKTIAECQGKLDKLAGDKSEVDALLAAANAQLAVLQRQRNDAADHEAIAVGQSAYHLAKQAGKN